MPVYPEIFDGPARSYRRDSSGRPILSRKRYITIHNTANDATAEGEASYAKRRTDGTSSHYYCDHDSIVQSLNTDWCAGHVGSIEGNTYGISYEITGVNGWSREQWLANVAWGKLAAAVARDCTHFGIPVRRLSIAEMRTKTAAGFVTHNDCRLAWGGTTHTDPGPGFPMDHLLNLVRERLNGDDMDQSELLIAKVNGGRRVADALADGVNLRDRLINKTATVAYAGDGRADAAWPQEGSALWNMEHLRELVAEVVAANPQPVHMSDGDRVAIGDQVSEDVLAKVLPLLNMDVLAAKVADLLAARLAQ